jgi:ribokinase
MPGDIVIIGSINMDLICRTRHIPRGGETVLGEHFMTVPGGKGANQAVAAAKLAARGSSVHLVGRVGDDDFGQRLLNGLKQHNVITNRITVSEGVSSGVAMILVDRRGENFITVVSGANARVLPADINAAEDLIQQASVVVLQLEIPLATVRHAIAMCRRHQVFVILDPAPAPQKMPRSLYQVDLFTPNQSEGETLLDRKPTHRVKRRRVEDPKQIAAELLARGARSVVLKLGSKGSIAAAEGAPLYHARPFKVKVVDTTAAGDAFTAALAVAHTEQLDWRDTLKFANAAGALTTTVFGAQPALPTRLAVEQLIKRSAR